ncbi:MAG TPA: hypothetical protein VHA37_02760, partial [Candidatus Saccharimonadales bacterium]|nr:hypothetical protein [Candidatus Saccharimonadales bacterium]
HDSTFCRNNCNTTQHPVRNWLRRRLAWHCKAQIRLNVLKHISTLLQPDLTHTELVSNPEGLEKRSENVSFP